jgi:hypothetical protein
LNKAKETSNTQKAELKERIEVSTNAVLNVPQLESLIRTMQGKLSCLDFESKRLALNALDITVWLDGQNVEVTGIIEPENSGVGCSNLRDECYSIINSEFSRSCI